MGVITSISRDSFSSSSAVRRGFAFEEVNDEICGLGWEALDANQIMQVAKAYYYFSIQFRENLEVACSLCPEDEKLRDLRMGECQTDNLSPWPGVAAPGEKLDHDEFVRRLLCLQDVEREHKLAMLGDFYLGQSRNIEPRTRAASISSYEDGGLSRVFQAMLRAPDWPGAGPLAFRFFLEQHIRFDSDEGGGHGALSRHLQPHDNILPLWLAFKNLLVAAVPALASENGVGAYSNPATAAAE
jgi:hypothetical protein